MSDQASLNPQMPWDYCLKGISESFAYYNFILVKTFAHTYMYTQHMYMYDTYIHTSIYVYMYTVVCMENNTIINNPRINGVFHVLNNCKPTFAHPVYVNIDMSVYVHAYLYM